MTGSAIPRPFRLSIIEYLNALPLNYGFRHGLGGALFDLHFHVPALCADRLRAGDVDAGLISSIEYARIPGLQLVPGLCIASPERATSVLIASKVPWSEIQTLALDPSSRTSNVLGQLILRERFQLQPRARELGAELDVALEICDAAVIIGDRAMNACLEGLRVMDLAEEWRQWLGLPFVFAVWAVREDAPLFPHLVHLFHESLRQGREALEMILREVGPRFCRTPEALRDYLTRHITYDLGPSEVESLGVFYHLAAKHGFADGVPKLRFL